MNNNTTSEVCDNNLSYDKLLHISSIIWRVSGLLSVIIGVPGHLLQIIFSLNKTSRKDPTTLYFIAIAICELVFLLGLFWLWCANMSIVKIDPRQIFSCGIFYSLLVGSTTLSNLYLATMSIDRSIMILSPVRYRSIVTRSHVIIRLILILIITIVFLIPHHFYFSYEPKLTYFLCNFHPSVNHRQVRLWTLVHALLFVSIPSLVVCISSFILLHNRCKHKQIHKKNLSPNARRLHRRSIFIFFVSVWMFLSLSSSCILEVFIIQDRLFHHDHVCSIRWKVYKILLHCLLIFLSINYSMKFYIHMIISTRLRQSFIRLISCQFDENQSASSRQIVGNKNEQRLLPPMTSNKTQPTEI